MSDFWDEFKSNSDFVKFAEVGDSVVGTITAIRKGKDFKGEPCPELLLRRDDGTETTVTAGQKVLQSKLSEVRPNVGDKIAITYSGVGDAKPGQAPAKLFDVAVKPGEGAVQAGPALSAADLF